MVIALAYRNYTFDGSLKETKGGQYCVISMAAFFLRAIHRVYFRVLKSNTGGETANRPRFSAIECPFLSITNKINFTLIRHSHTIGAPVRPNEEI